MTNTNPKKWQTTSSKYLVSDRWIKLRSDSCTTPDGHVIEPFYVLEYPDWVSCFVVDDNNDVIMVNHYRHGIDKYIPELVGGGLETDDTSPEDGMRRELKEELGYTGGKIYEVGVSYPNSASQNNKVHSFLAIGGSCRHTQKLEQGENLSIVKIPFKNFVEMLENYNSGEIYQSIHLATMLLALNFIKRSKTASIQKLLLT